MTELKSPPSGGLFYAQKKTENIIMPPNYQFPKFSGSGRNFLFVIVATTVFFAFYWHTSEKNKKSNTNHQLTKSSLLSTSDQQQIQQESSEVSLADFLSNLLQNQQDVANENSITGLPNINYGNSGSSQNEEDHDQTNRILAETQQTQKETEYQQLINDFNQIEGDDKILLLHRIWQLAPEVGIDENLLTLLQLATYDPDTQVEKISREILNDLQRFRDGIISQEEQLVSQIMEMNNNQHRSDGSDGSFENSKPLIDDQVEPGTASPVKIAQQKNEKIDQLTKLALTSENTKTREYALMNLVQLDHDATLDIIQYQLLNSSSSDERFKAIEILRSSIGDYDSDKIRQILEIASGDYDAGISENASDILIMLDNYVYAQDNIAPPEIQPETINRDRNTY